MPTQLKPSLFRTLLYDWIRLTIPTLAVCELLRFVGLWHRRPSGSKERDGFRILVIRIDHIGDAVLFSAALRELRRVYPRAHITLVVSPEALAISAACPYVDKVLSLPAGPVSIRFTVRRIAALLRFCKLHFAGQHFDLAVLPRWDADRDYATIIGWYSQADRRICFSRHCTREKRLLNWGFGRYYTDVLPPGEVKHEVERGLDMVRYLGAEPSDSSLELWLTQEDRDFAESWWMANGLAAYSEVMACALGATKAQCRWPAREFARLIDRVSRSGEHRIATLLICAPNERDLAREVSAYTQAAVFLPLTANVRQAAALIARCSLLIGNNSGPIHLAAAAGLPVVEISCHPANGDPADELNPKRYGAFSRAAIVVQPREPIHPCIDKCNAWHQHCVTAVKMEDVSEAVLTLLAARRIRELETRCNS